MMRVWPVFLAGTGALGVALASGCSTGRCDPTTEDCGEDAENRSYAGPMALRSVVASCVGGQRALDLVLDGAAASASVAFVSHDAEGIETWSERHRVPVASADDAGWWQARWLTLSVADTTGCATLAACGGRYSPGERTLFACSDTEEAADTAGDSGQASEVPALTVVLDLVDAADRDREVCYTWGDVSGASSGCLPWEPQ